MQPNDPLFDEVSDFFQIESSWLRAVAKIESNYNEAAVPRWEPHLAEHSYGVGQFLPSTALWIARTDRQFPLPDSVRELLLAASEQQVIDGEKVVARCLMDPNVGVYLIESYISYQLKRYDGDITAAVAAYNAGSARRKDTGLYVNQWHVDKFHDALDVIQGE